MSEYKATPLYDLFWKLSLLWEYVFGAYEQWKRDIWKKSPDGYYCCNGFDCCCGGASVREVHGRVK